MGPCGPCVSSEGHTQRQTVYFQICTLGLWISARGMLCLLDELVHHDQTILIPLLGPWEWSQEIKVQLLCWCSSMVYSHLSPNIVLWASTAWTTSNSTNKTLCLPYYPIPKETLPQTGFGTLDPLVSKWRKFSFSLPLPCLYPEDVSSSNLKRLWF